MPHDTPILDYVLGGFDEAVFFRDYWGRKPFLLQDGVRHRFDGLFGIDELEDYLFVARPPVGDVQLVRKGEWPPMAAVKGLFTPASYTTQEITNGLASGYTIVLNAVHYRWPPAARVVTALEDRLSTSVQTNIYVTGPNGQGFAQHEDAHDVLVLQTHGSKRWQIFDRTRGGTGELLHDVVLQPGDVLYMPKGFPHAATTSDDLSIHVTVGLFPMTWLDLAQQTIGRLARLDPRWQDPVPLPATGGTLPATVDLAARLQAGLAGLPDLTGVVDGHTSTLSATARRRNPPPGGYLRTLARLHQMEPGTLIERRAGVGCTVTSDERSAWIHFMGESIRTPVTAARALRFIAASPRFRIQEVDDVLSDASKVVLVRRLVREGLLQAVQE